jgi:hypothetical protein
MNRSVLFILRVFFGTGAVFEPDEGSDEAEGGAYLVGFRHA